MAKRPSREREEENIGAKLLITSSKERDRFYQKLDPYQKEYYNSIDQYSVIMVDQPAGTGKTTIAFLKGLQMLSEGKVAHLIYFRFPDKRYGKLGFLTGNKEEKEAPLMIPLYQACAECGLQPETIKFLMQEESIIATSDIGMRGVNLQDSFVIIDETQNGEIADIQLILTRIHDRNCKCLMIGHSGQTDNNVKRFGTDKLIPFQVYIKHMLKKPWSINCVLPINYRGEISKHADNIQETINELEW